VIEADEVLVNRSRSGDRSAFEELVRRTGRLVYAQAFLETGNAFEAEDLTQETFLLAWRSIRQVNRPGGLRAWLMSILHSALIDSIRRKGRKKRSGVVAGEMELMRIADDRRGPDDHAEKREQMDRALSVLRSLPQEYRDVLVLRYLAGADYETIGRQLAISNGSLRGLLSRGLAMLREEMNRGEKS
jgi:RNA polymerase sigma-70 factor (ECF subfamily)